MIIFFCRCEGISIIKINVLKVHNYEVQGMPGLHMVGARLSTMKLFILMNDEGQGISDEWWNSLITRVQVAMIDK